MDPQSPFSGLSERVTGPIFDAEDDALFGALTQAMLLEIDDPLMATLRDMLCELSLRVREVRRHCKFEATEHNGQHWVRADRILDLMGGAR